MCVQTCMVAACSAAVGERKCNDEFVNFKTLSLKNLSPGIQNPQIKLSVFLGPEN